MTRPEVERLRQIPLFSACTASELERLASVGSEVTIEAGTTLMRQGSTDAVECFVITDGEVSVFKDSDRVATLGPGAIVGEMSAVDGLPRSATVVVNTPVRAIRYSSAEFQEVLLASPSAARRVMRVVASRIREAQGSDLDWSPLGADEFVVAEATEEQSGNGHPSP